MSQEKINKILKDFVDTVSKKKEALEIEEPQLSLLEILEIDGIKERKVSYLLADIVFADEPDKHYTAFQAKGIDLPNVPVMLHSLLSKLQEEEPHTAGHLAYLIAAALMPFLKGEKV